MKARKWIAVFSAAILAMVVTACDRSTDNKSTANTATKSAADTSVTQQQSSNATSSRLATTAMTQPATRSIEAYRDLKPEDGFHFQSLVTENVDISVTEKGDISYVVDEFDLVSSAGNVIKLELVDKNVTHLVEGRIRTKIFGDIIATKQPGDLIWVPMGLTITPTGVKNSGPGALSYAATESQIKKIQEFLGKKGENLSTTQSASTDFSVEQRMKMRRLGLEQGESDTKPKVSSVLKGSEASFALMGILKNRSGYTAYFKDISTEKISEVAVGDSIARGTIKSIDLNTVIYDAAGKSRRIEPGQSLTGEATIPGTMTTSPTTMPVHASK